MKKNRHLLYFLVLIFINNVISVNAQIMDKTLKMDYEHYKLKNGLEIVLQQDTAFKNVSVEFWIKDGFRIDTKYNYGLMHFYEHIMPYSIMDSLSYSLYKKLRTDSNAQVRPDYSRYYLEMKPEGLPYALERVSGRLKAPTNFITEKRIEYERKRVLSEIERNSSNPLWSAQGSMALQTGTFGKEHPYGHNAYGLIENNKRFKLKDFQKRHEEIIYANNVILFIVGNFKIKETKELIKNHLSNLSGRSKKSVKIASSVHSKYPKTMFTPSAIDTINTLTLSWQIPLFESKDNDALALFSEILEKRIEGKQATNRILSSEVYTELYEFAGKFTINMKFEEKKDSLRIERLIKNELQSLLLEGFSSKELEHALRSERENIGEMCKYLGFQGSRTELLGEGLLFASDPNFYFERLDRQHKLTIEDVQKTAKKWLENNPFRILFISRDKAVIKLNNEALKLSEFATTSFTKSILNKVKILKAPNELAEIYYNKSAREAIGLTDYTKILDSTKYTKLGIDTEFYYYTLYGSPLAYVLPFEVLGNELKESNNTLKVLDFGFGTIGHLLLLAKNRHIAHGVEIDPILELLYKKEDKENEKLKLFYGYFPKDNNLVLELDTDYDIFISKNTLKKGYIHPEVDINKKYLLKLGVSDEVFLRSVYKLLKSNGYFLIYNLHGKIASKNEDYKPWTDGRSPFTKEQYIKAGFKIIAFNGDDTKLARKVGEALGWHKQMDFEKDLFATYTLLQKI